ncbi:MAG: polyphosphate kinase 1 [Deltaproteobacteria bacterium]
MQKIPYIHRDISWMQFNYRVLQEAKDVKSNPLFERLKFLAIYSGNLAEFFKVRIAHHKNLYKLRRKIRKELRIESEKVLEQLLWMISEQQLEFTEIFNNQIIPELKANGIILKKRQELNRLQIKYIESYFQDNLLPYVQPMLLQGKKIQPFLNNAALYLAIELADKKTGKLEYALIQIPSDKIKRFVVLPQSEEGIHEIIFLDDIIRHNISYIFPGYNIIQSYSIKLTRDADLYIDDEYSGDLISKIKESLNKRNVGPPSMLVYDREMPQHFLKYLMDVFDLDNMDIMAEGRYHNNSDFFKFPDFGKNALKLQELYPLSFSYIEDTESIFNRLKERDYLLNFPYVSYESVIRFFEDSAIDADVTNIKLIQYRVASQSRIMEALKLAVRNGKKVTAFIELKARFDEEANLKWGNELEKAGVNVIYSFPGIKVHAKMALIIRKTVSGFEKFGYFSTGNFHEGTARIYSDFGLFTNNKKLTAEAQRVFEYLENRTMPKVPFRYLLVGQFNMRQKFIELVRKEIEYAKSGKSAYIILKMNSVQEPEIINLLYEASQAGVKIKMIIRGICSLVAGVKDISENISVISILDRYLEHSRVFIFGNKGREKIYFSSADWMERNLYRRIEIAFPILDPDIRKIVKDIIELQLDDNIKARSLDHRKTNMYVKKGKSGIQSQKETYMYFKSKLLKKNKI